MMAKKQTLLEKAKAIGVPHRQRHFWLDELPQEQQDELNALRDAFQAGQLPGWTPRTIYDQLVVPNGIKIGVTYETFRAWVSNYYGKKEK